MSADLTDLNLSGSDIYGFSIINNDAVNELVDNNLIDDVIIYNSLNRLRNPNLNNVCFCL